MGAIPLPDQCHCYLADESAQLAFAQQLASTLRYCRGLVFLHGHLGAGKTTFVRGLLRGLGYHGLVRSPTYTLIESYSFAEWQVIHIDLYRLSALEELEYLGWRDLLDAGCLLLIEWPERAESLLPVPDWRITLDIVSPGRQIVITAP
jgi:tRNA threonylcarbamoyladenosine biosynthesis protein TsaE